MSHDFTVFPPQENGVIRIMYDSLCVDVDKENLERGIEGWKTATRKARRSLLHEISAELSKTMRKISAGDINPTLEAGERERTCQNVALLLAYEIAQGRLPWPPEQPSTH